MRRVAQITDIHIAEDGVDTRGADVRENLARVLDAVRALRVDELVVSGDLCYRDPAPSIYAWLRPTLDALGTPYVVMPGNHDDTAMLLAAFGTPCSGERAAPGARGRAFFTRESHGRTEIFLDTSTCVLPDDQLAHLEEGLARSDRPIVWMHHPPLLAGVQYMDANYPLANHERVLGVLQAAAKPVDVFVGHYHVERTVRAGDVTVHLTPSTYFAIRPEPKEFAVEHTRPGFRLVEHDARTLFTRVIWV